MPSAWASGGGIDAAVLWNNGNAYMFRGEQYLRYDVATFAVEIAPRTTAAYWKSWPKGWTKLSAAINNGDGKAYFFKDSLYMRWDMATIRKDPDYPRPIDDGFSTWPTMTTWPTTWTTAPDAGFMMPYGYAYFFRGDEYIKYDSATNTIMSGYPKKIAAEWDGWPATWTSVDAAFARTSKRVYFFRGTKYIRYTMGVGVDSGYPKTIATEWSGWPAQPATSSQPWFALDGAYQVFGSTKVFFFSKSQLLRYDWNTSKVDAGYPIAVASTDLPSGYASSRDAVVGWDSRRAYFFKGTQYLRYDTSAGRVDCNDAAPKFNVAFKFPAGFDPVFQTQFRRAAQRWSDIITSSSSNWSFVEAQVTCCAKSVTIPASFAEDVLIEVMVDATEEMVIAEGCPCWFVP